jgi:7,8-dihydro-6-hydroxymethylpterin-pyrophosphokinase
MTLTVIALGSNLDNPPRQLKEACLRLSRLQDLTGLKCLECIYLASDGPTGPTTVF